MGWKGMSINVEQEYLVTYTVTHGHWTGVRENRRFTASGTPEIKAMKVVAKDFQKAKSIAFAELSKHRTLNEFVRVERAVPIPKKKEVV